MTYAVVVFKIDDVPTLVEAQEVFKNVLELSSSEPWAKAIWSDLTRTHKIPMIHGQELLGPIKMDEASRICEVISRRIFPNRRAEDVWFTTGIGDSEKSITHFCTIVYSPSEIADDADLEIKWDET